MTIIASTAVFTTSTPSPALIFSIKSVAYSPSLGRWCGAAQNNTIYTSTDMVTWVATNVTTAAAPLNMVWNGSTFLCVGQTSNAHLSSDGLTFTTGSVGISGMGKIIWTGTYFVAFPNSTTATNIWYSTNGVTWVSITVKTVSGALGSAVFMGDACWGYNIGMGIAVKNTASNIYLTSYDSINWVERVFPNSDARTGVAWNGSVFCVTGASGVLTSPDGINWTLRAQVAAAGTTLASAGECFFLSAGTNALASNNGVTWTTTSLGASSGSNIQALEAGPKAAILSSVISSSIAAAAAAGTGVINAFMPRATLEGVGNYNSIGSASILMPPVTLSATGSQNSGSAAIIMPAPTLIATASEVKGAWLTMPTPFVTAAPISFAYLSMPPPVVVGYGPGYADIKAPVCILNAVGHDSYGERFFGGSLPMPTLLVYGGANADLTAPPSVLSITGTATSLGNAILPCPVPALQASGRISSMGVAALKPVDSFSIIGYSGAICSIALTGGMTIAATGTSGAVGRVSLSLPLFELTATGARQNQGSAGLLLPSPYLASGGVAYLIAPQGQLTAIGHAVVAITYEAYAVNLQHRPKRGVEPIDEVTRYTNFPFTQIVRYQNNYFGVASDGLYLLEGTTDGGAATPYTVKTAVSDFDTAEKKTVLSAYFGGRIGPDMTVTLHAGDIGQGVYPYTTPRGQLVQNYREKFARGIKDRYFALGIAGVGAMELDTVELEVNKLTRRI